MAPQSAQVFFAYLLMAMAIAPVGWLRPQPGMSPAARQRTILGTLLLRSAGFLVVSWVILGLAGDEIEPMLQQAGEWGAVAWGREVLADGGALLLGCIVLGVTVAAGRAVLLARRTQRAARLRGFAVWNYLRAGTPSTRGYYLPPETGANAHLPQSVAELVTAGVLGSIVVGATEEILFRAELPALLLKSTGDFGLAVVVSLIVFAVFHAYQGW